MRFFASILFILSCLWACTDDQITQPLIPTDTLGTILPDYQIHWSDSTFGCPFALDITRDGQFVYLASADSQTIHLYKYSLSGGAVWYKSINKGDPWTRITNLTTSNSGNLLCVTLINEANESYLTDVFTGEGTQVEVHTQNGEALYPSPSGNYLTVQTTDYTPLEVYTNTGALRSVTESTALDSGHQMHRFVVNDEMLVFQECPGNSYLHLIDIETGQILWTEPFGKYLWLIDFNGRNCAFNDNYFALRGTADSYGIHLFDYTGQMKWVNNGYGANDGLAFSNDNQVLLALVDVRQVAVIDPETGDQIALIPITDRNISGVVSLDYYQNTLFVSHVSPPYEERLQYGEFVMSYIVTARPGEESQSYKFDGVLDSWYDNQSNQHFIVSAERDSSQIVCRVK